MDIIQIIEIVALVMGIPYMILEVLQKNTMWYFGLFTSTACAIQFFLESNWANMGLNIYYVGMAFWGLYQWRKAIFVFGTGLLVWLLTVLNDSNPWLDALSTCLCVIGMLWLAKSIPYHWILWVIGDTILVVMCFMAGKYWMTALYVAYVIASSYGFFHWKKKGEYVA